MKALLSLLLLIPSLSWGSNEKSQKYLSNIVSSNQDMRTASFYSGENLIQWNLYEVQDINEDGFDDLIFGTYVNDKFTGAHSPTEFSKPIIFFWSQQNNSYEVNMDVQEKLPYLHYPRHIMGSKNLITNDVELFIADTGLDGTHAPNCGGINKLITFKKDGSISSISPNDVNDYSHGLASADLNDDGKMDYLILNSPYITVKDCDKGKYSNDSVLLISEPTNKYKVQKVNFKYKNFGNKPHYDAGLITEFDGSFMFIGGRGHGDFKPGIDVFDLNIDGNLTAKQFISAPEIMKNNPSYSILVIQDNIKELSILANVVETGYGWRGRYIQKLDWDGSKFIDVSDNVEQSNPEKQNDEKCCDWCTTLDFFELDGKDFLSCNSITPYKLQRPKIYQINQDNITPVSNTKDSNFSPAFTNSDNREIHPVVLGDKTYLVGWKNSIYPFVKINLIELVEEKP